MDTLNGIVTDNPCIVGIFTLIIGAFIGDLIKAIYRISKRALSSVTLWGALYRIEELESEIKLFEDYAAQPQMFTYQIWYRVSSIFTSLIFSLGIFYAIHAMPFSPYLTYIEVELLSLPFPIVPVPQYFNDFFSFLFIIPGVFTALSFLEALKITALLKKMKNFNQYKTASLKEIDDLKRKYKL